MWDSLFDSKKAIINPNEKYEDFVARLEQKYSNKVEALESTQQIEINELKSTHELEVKELNFKIAHNESEDTKKAKDELVKEQTKNAVLEQKVEMLDKIVDLNADVIDVKDLVTQLINKLPEVKISSLAGGSSKSEK
jgi:hypothetical protein